MTSVYSDRRVRLVTVAVGVVILLDLTRIAQARIAYGGRGQITDVQQPRYGQQVLDVLLPF